MIIDVEKVVFLGVKDDLNTFFEQAQKEGVIEFIAKKHKPTELSAKAQDIVRALKALRGEAKVKQVGVKPGTDPIIMAEEICHLKQNHTQLEEKERLLRSEIARIAPLGHFSLQDIAEIASNSEYIIQFFCVKRAKKKIPSPELIYITSEYDLDYFLSIQKEHKTYPEMIEMHIEKPLRELEEKLRSTQKEIHTTHKKLLAHSSHVSFLKQSLIKELNESNLTLAKSEIDTQMQTLFSIQGWVPKNHLETLKKLPIQWYVVAKEKDDRVPTYMENTHTGEIGEDLVKIYDTPSPTDKDPSKWVFWSFACFFAIIVADAGYGMLYLALALFLRTKMRNRFVSMLTILSTCCIIWGLLTASFFGISFSPDAYPSRFSAIQYLAKKKAQYHIKQKDDVYTEWVEQIPELANARDGHAFLVEGKKVKEGKTKYEVRDEFESNVLIELALIIGIVHLSLSMLRYIRRSLSSIGWIAAMIGGLLYFPIYLGATSMVQYLGLLSKETAATAGMQLLVGGASLALALALIQNRLRGFAELTKVIEIFADVLSYLRLYALGLAGMMLASTFNDLGAKVGLIGGFVVILIGHAINMMIGIMGGVIHGLRLNFIEWYHYSFDGGGKPFKPLRRM